MATAFYGTTSTSAVHSFFAIDDFDFSQPFDGTPSDHSFCCPPTSDPFQCEPHSEPQSDSGSEPDLGSPCGSSIGLAVVNSGLASCTEGLGFESSNTMVSDDNACCDCCSINRMISEDDCYKRRDNRENSSPAPEKKDFPPPLSSLSENGRRNFMLRQMRNNGRLEIVRVLINRPEILCTSRQNGRLRLHLVFDDECEYDDAEEETGEEVENEEEEEAEERENEVEEATEVEVDAAAEEDREWNVPAVRRCYQREVSQAWGQQQHRYVTTM